MLNEEFFKIVDGENKDRVAILKERGNSYDKSNSDMLLSFKNTAKIANALKVAGCTDFKGSDIANILLILKQVRDSNMKSCGLLASNKYRVDSNTDLHNYISLKLANEIDEEGE